MTKHQIVHLITYNGNVFYIFSLIRHHYIGKVNIIRNTSRQKSNNNGNKFLKLVQHSFKALDEYICHTTNKASECMFKYNNGVCTIQCLNVFVRLTWIVYYPNVKYLYVNII